MKGCRLKSKETEIVKHSKPKGEETEREFETVRHKLKLGLGLGLELYYGIKAIKMVLYGGRKGCELFSYFQYFKIQETILKLKEKLKKKYGNDMAVDMA